MYQKKSLLFQRHHFLILLLFLGFLYLFEILTANRSYINQTGREADYMSNAQYFVTALGAFILLAGCYIVAYKNFKVRLSPIFFVGGALFLCCALVPIIYPYLTGGTTGMITLLRHISFAFLLVAGVVFTLGLFPKTTNGTYLYSIIAFVFLVIAFVACIYSYIDESEMYSRIFQGDFPRSTYDVPESFTGNRNTFAWLLLIGQISLSYLETRKGHFIHWVLMVFLFVNQFFIISKTGIILSSLLLVVFAIYRFVVGVKKNVVKTLIIAVATILFAIVSIAVLEVAIGEYLNQFFKYLAYIMNEVSDIYANSIQNRINSWHDAVAIVSGSNFTKLFGYGYDLWEEVLYGYKGKVVAMDITWGLNLIQNGYVGLAISAVIWLYVLFIIFKAMSQKMRGGFLFVLLWLMFLARSFIESANFVKFDIFGIMLYAFIYFPCASHIEKRKLELGKDVMDPKFLAVHYPNAPSLGKIYAYLNPLFALAFAFSEVFMNRYMDGASYVYLLVSLAVAYVIAPLFLYGHWMGIKKGKAGAGIFGIMMDLAYLLLAAVLPILQHNAFSVAVPLALAFIGFICFIVCASKETFGAAMWSNLFRNIVFMAIVGGGFFSLLHFYPLVHNAYCLAFIIVDILLMCLVVDAGMFKSNWPTIDFYENKIERLSYRLEVAELTGIMTKKSRREEKYDEINIYNV